MHIYTGNYEIWGSHSFLLCLFQISSWQIPTEVSELMLRQESVQPKENLSRPDVNQSSELVTASSVPVISTGGHESAAVRITSLLGTPSSALDLVKKKLQDAGTTGSSNPVSASSVGTTQELNGLRKNEATGKDLQSESNRDKLKEANGNENISDSSSDSEGADTGLTKEELVLQFKVFFPLSTLGICIVLTYNMKASLFLHLLFWPLGCLNL